MLGIFSWNIGENAGEKIPRYIGEMYIAGFISVWVSRSKPGSDANNAKGIA